MEELLDAVRHGAPRATTRCARSRAGWSSALAVARAVLHDPELLLLDEPRANLDPAAAELVEPLIGRASGRTRVLTSHDPAAGWPRPTSCSALRGRAAGARAASRGEFERRAACEALYA